MNQPNSASLNPLLVEAATFQVVLNGLHPTVSAPEAKAKLAALFKATPGQVETLLAQHGYVVKKGCTTEVARKYKSAIDGAGGACELVPEAPVMPLEVDLPVLEPIGAKVEAGSSAVAPVEAKVFCAKCGAPIVPDAAFCGSCGAAVSSIAELQPTAPQAQATPPKPSQVYASYDQVPWFRKSWFIILGILVFAPVTLYSLFSSDIYYLKNGQLVTYSKNAKIASIVIALMMTLSAVGKILSSDA